MARLMIDMAMVTTCMMMIILSAVSIVVFVKIIIVNN